MSIATLWIFPGTTCCYPPFIPLLSASALLSASISFRISLRKDECWGEIFRIRHLRVVGGVSPISSPSPPPSPSPSPTSTVPSAPPALDAERDAAVPVAERHVSTQTPGRGLAHAPLRRAVIAHARALSRALRLFDVAVSDGGTTKAVINGPVSTNTVHWELYCTKLGPFTRNAVRFISPVELFQAYAQRQTSLQNPCSRRYGMSRPTSRGHSFGGTIGGAVTSSLLPEYLLLTRR